MEVPQLLRNRGLGRVVIDIGLGFDAAETRDAVKAGWVVFAFEPLPGNIANIKRILADNERDSILFVEYKEVGGSWQLTSPLSKPQPGVGFAYIFHAGMGDSSGSAYMESHGLSVLSG